MTPSAQWPPISPHAALLSSPSGRRKYEDFKNGISPMKQPATTPSLVDRLRAARTNNDFPPQGESPEEEEDEETLQLELAAIEAKLRLKKLQKEKGRAATPARDLFRPSSAYGPPAPQIEVKASPTKRIQASLPKSPSRVLLGIDKGVRAADISLKRANTTGNRRPRADSEIITSNTSTARSSAFNSARSTISSRDIANVEGRKTFSERMTEARERETTIEQRRATTIRNRSTGFGIDQAEVESYRTAAETEPRIQQPSKSPTRQYFEYSRDQVLNAATAASTGSRYLKKSRTMPNLRASPSVTTDGASEGEAALYEDFSGLHLTTRILPYSFLKRTLPSEKFTIYRIPDLLKNVHSPAYELPDTICDYVIFGVIASKSSPMDHRAQPNGGNNAEKSTVGTKDWERQWEDGSRNHRRFMALTLTDLTWSIDLYLFGTALPRYHRLTAGTVVAILNPGIMPPKPGKSDTGAFSLSLSSDSDTVLEIGQARDLGHCKTLKKDGKECGSWVNAGKTTICEWHLNAEIQRTKASRMGVNTGTNGFARREHQPMMRDEDGRSHRGLANKDGRKYDREAGGHYYVASTGPKTARRVGNGLARSDDPFVHAIEGELSRPSERDARLRKHLAAQAKEREIAEKLGSRAHSGFGFDSAGAEYLRHRLPPQDAKNKQNGQISSDAAGQRSAAISRTILSSGSNTTNESRKRTAADVRLSPVKKTRFVTEKGIREAGRESLGAPVQSLGHGSDSEDELEIV